MIRPRDDQTIIVVFEADGHGRLLAPIRKKVSGKKLEGSRSTTR